MDLNDVQFARILMVIRCPNIKTLVTGEVSKGPLTQDLTWPYDKCQAPDNVLENCSII